MLSVTQLLLIMMIGLKVQTTVPSRGNPSPRCILCASCDHVQSSIYTFCTLETKFVPVTCGHTEPTCKVILPCWKSEFPGNLISTSHSVLICVWRGVTKQLALSAAFYLVVSVCIYDLLKEDVDSSLTLSPTCNFKSGILNSFLLPCSSLAPELMIEI